jgi:hypothetical protein
MHIHMHIHMYIDTLLHTNRLEGTKIIWFTQKWKKSIYNNYSTTVTYNAITGS